MKSALQQVHADVNRLLLRANHQRHDGAGDRHPQSAAQPSGQPPHALPPPGLSGRSAQRRQRSGGDRYR